MRIIAGQNRGLRLQTLPGLQTRPTTERVREAIFSSLAPRLPGARVWDMFAGTGAMGLEALSRGAERALFTEKHRQTLAVLEKNIALCRAESAGTVLKGDVFQHLDRPRPEGPFDLIFMDPPYAANLYQKALRAIVAGDYLAENGMIVVESAKKSLFSFDDTVFLVHKRKTYGESCIHYLMRQTNAQEE